MFKQFGIGARLLLAFCGISLFAVLSGAATLYAFIVVGKLLNQVGQIDAPRAILALELSRQAKRRDKRGAFVACCQKPHAA